MQPWRGQGAKRVSWAITCARVTCAPTPSIRSTTKFAFSCPTSPGQLCSSLASPASPPSLLTPLPSISRECWVEPLFSALNAYVAGLLRVTVEGESLNSLSYDDDSVDHTARGGVRRAGGWRGTVSPLALLEAPPVVAALPEVAAPLPEDPLQPAPPPQLASTRTRAATASVPFIVFSLLLVEVG
jgi:hypothetical protein